MDKQEKIQKAIDEIVEKVLDTEKVEKAIPESLPANGGKDEIKAGSPHSGAEEPQKEEEKEEEKKMNMKKAEDKEDEKEEDEKPAEKKIGEKVEEKKHEAKESKKEEKKEDKKEKMEKKMKKSLEELVEHLDEEELELIKAWREDAEEVIVDEPKEDITKSINALVDEKLESLNKSLVEKDELIKSMSEKLEKLSSQPAYDKRSLSTLEPLEKSEEATQTISKTQVLDTMLRLQLAGKGVNSRHIAEFEATNNISSAVIKTLVMNEVKGNNK